MRSASAAPRQKTEALLFVIHFVGDLHQPLHAADNDDRGGNCVAVDFLGHAPESSGPNQSYRPNLHGVWDTDLVEQMSPAGDASAFANALRTQFASNMKRWLRERVDVDAWAWESHRIAIKTVYGRLPTHIPFEPPRTVTSCADHDIGKRMFDLHEEIDPQYVAAVSPVIRQRLTVAGTRLAALLNQVWP